MVKQLHYYRLELITPSRTVYKKFLKKKNAAEECQKWIRVRMEKHQTGKCIIKKTEKDSLIYPYKRKYGKMRMLW